MKPYFETIFQFWDTNELSVSSDCFEINSSLLPEVTFENSPQEVEIEFNQSDGIWLARRKKTSDDKKEPSLCVYKDKPISHYNGDYFENTTKGTWFFGFVLNEDLFPNITFENSPVEIGIKLKKNGTE